MKKKELILFFIVINIIIAILLSTFPIKAYAVTQKLSNDIEGIDEKKYPGIKNVIKQIKNEHKNWNFKVMYTGLDWDEVINQEGKHGRNIIEVGQSRYNGDWICPVCGNKRYSGGKWVCNSPMAIAYMMDPRNSFAYQSIFQFLELSYDQKTKYNTDIIKKILKNTFLDDGNLDSYAKTIMEQSGKKNVNPYYIAVKIIQEQGTKGGSTFKMESNGKYYYNIFNINACGTTRADILRNALSWAKDKGWDTIEKCLIGGVEFIAKGYINAGQDTLYFEKFDVIGDSLYWHQYAQDLLYAENQGTKLRNILERIDAVELAYTFVIPLYENMPKEACVRPLTESEIKSGKTYDKKEEEKEDNSKETNTDNTNTTSNTSTNTTSNTSTNTTSENTTNTSADEKDTKEEEYDLGDINNDGKINSGDLLMVRKYLIGSLKAKDENQTKAMDVNKDNKINSGDLLIIRKHLLGTFKIK